jgi:O-antigen ligase
MTILRTGICILVAFAVLAFGGVEPWGESIIEIGAVALLVWWGLAVVTNNVEDIRWAPILWPLLGLDAIALVQWAARLTVYPFLTRTEFLLLTSYLTLLFLLVQVFRTPRQWREFAWFVITFGFAAALFGILQDLTSNGKLYWFHVLRNGGMPYGPYVNRNHFAGLMELVAPLGLAMVAIPGVKRQQLPLVALLAALPVGALFLSASRGGIAAFGCEVVVLVILLWIGKGEKRHLLAFLVAIALAVGLVGWLGVAQVVSRFSDTHNPEVTERRRISMARGAWHIFLDHPVLGTGLGTVVSVYPRYETDYDGKIVDHVHNDHLEFLAETGALGGLCWLLFIAVLVYSALKNLSAHQDPFIRAVQLGALVGCIGLLIHGLVDFNLHIPANALLFYLLAGMAATKPVFSPTN